MTSPDYRPNGYADGLPRLTPEAAGMSSTAVDALLDDAAARRIELDSFMVWRSGAVVAEGWWWPYRADRPHMMHSATKSFLSAAVGLAIAEGRFGLADPVVSFFPGRIAAPPGSNLARMTVEDLLTQTSGHPHGMSGSKWRGIRTSWIDEFLKIPVAHEPGTTFTYSSATSFMLSAILTQVTGDSAHAYLTPRLLDPLGIRDLRWDVGPEGINPGGNGISCTTADLLKLAILHLQRGEWQGRQLLPRDWVVAATTPKRGNQHGYHWWTGPGGSFYAYGVFGQFAWVFPEHDGILAVTAAVPAQEAALRALVADHLPGMFEGINSERASSSALQTRCASLRLLPEKPCPGVETSFENIDVAFLAEPNDDGIGYVRLRTTADRACVHLGDARGEHIVEIGTNDWIESDTTMPGAGLHHGYEPGSLRVVAGGGWHSTQHFEAEWQFVETAFRDTIDLSFEGEGATFDRRVNVNTAATRRPTVRGRIVSKETPMLHATLMAAAMASQAAAAPAPTPAYSTTTTTIGELLDTPTTLAVLEADAPFVVHNPRIKEGRPYTLSDIVQYVPQLTPSVLARIDSDLAQVKRPLPPGEGRKQ